MLTSKNLGEVLPRDARLDRPALVEIDTGKQWSASQLQARADGLARGLMRSGLKRGQSVAIIAENSAEVLIAYLGIMRAGLVVVPVNYRLPAETVRYLLEDSAARACIVDRPRSMLVPPGVRRFEIGPESDPSLALPHVTGPAATVEPEEGEIAEILYTSGSTGLPKGVPLSHSGQLWALSVHVKPAQALNERTLIVAPMYHMNALFNICVALANDVQTVLMPRFEARAWLQAAARFQCSMLSGIPTMFALAARERELLATLDLSCVKRVTIGSAPLTDALLDRVTQMFPNATMRNGYGTTEAGPSIFGDHPDGLPTPAMSVGYPLSAVRVRLSGDPEPDEGVLEVRSPALMQGYLNLPQATAERVRDGWYITGDIMRRDADGFYYFVGRADDMFVCGGENVYPGEIERMLERHPAILQAAVVPVADEVKGHIPIAFIVTAPGTTLSSEELKAFALREGPAYSHPRAFVWMDHLPLAGTHKVDKKPLLERAVEVARELGRRAG